MINLWGICFFVLSVLVYSEPMVTYLKAAVINLFVSRHGVIYAAFLL